MGSTGKYLMRWVRSYSMLVALVLANATSPLAAETTTAPNVYVIEMDIARAGGKIASPKITALFGKPVQLTQANPKSDHGNFRMQVQASPGSPTKAGDKTVEVSLTVLEQVSGVWVVVGESTMKTIEGKRAYMSVSGAMELQFAVKVVSAFDPRAVSFKGAQCDPTIASKALFDTCPQCDSLPCPQCKDCCSASCQDGSGLQLRCCGGLECCSCGTCCSPPPQ